MKTALKVVGGLVALVVLVVAVMAAGQPDETHVERSVLVAAAPADVFPFANDFDQWMKWNPWQAMDPDQTVTFSDNRVGPGAWYAWKSDKVGEGKMSIRESVPNEKVTEELAFTAPMASVATVTFSFAPEGDGTRVTWSFDQPNEGMGKVAGVFMDMDKMLGADFERGLDTLKPLAEDAAKARLAAEEAAAKAAAEAAAAEALVEGEPAPE